MIKCPFCQAMQALNTLFCNECGTYLSKEDDQGTDPLGTDELKWAGEDQPKANRPAKSDPTSICLIMCDSGREFEGNLNNAVHLGRVDPPNNIFPEIDLTIEDGLSKGVSRRHARIFKKEGVVMVEDIGSINGTSVNGNRLAPYLPETLHHGDQLQLGKLLIEIELRESTAHAGASTESGSANNLEMTVSKETLEFEVRELLNRGRKIEAVKKARQLTGWDLKEAKDFVDSL